MSVALQVAVDDDDAVGERQTGAQERAERAALQLRSLLSPPAARQTIISLVPAVFMANILTFLDARELAVMGACSRYTLEVSRDAFLWSSLYRRDFEFFANGRAEEAEAEAEAAAQAVVQADTPLPPLPPLPPAAPASWLSWGSSPQPPPPPAPYAPVTPSDSDPGAISSSPAPPSSAGPRLLQSRSKDEYLARFRRVHGLIRAAQRDKEERIRTLARENRLSVHAAECCLDWTQMRLMTPLQLGAVFSSVLLFAIYVDGATMSVWFVALPFLAFFAYLFASVAALAYVYRHQDSRQSACFGLWVYVRGPVRAVASLLGHSPRLVVLALVCAMLACLQVVLVALKISNPERDLVPAYVPDGLPWGVVFLPIWLLLGVYVVLPEAGCCREDGTLHALGVAFLWLPLLALFVCLCSRLTYQDARRGVGAWRAPPSALLSSSSPPPVDRPVRLAEMFVPLWLVELGNMAFTLLYLVLGLVRMRRGLLVSISEHVHIFVSSWCFISPFVVLQALLAARDDGPGGGPGARQNVPLQAAVAPLLFFLAWYAVLVLAFVCRARSPLQARRAQRRQQESGTRELFLI